LITSTEIRRSRSSYLRAAFSRFAGLVEPVIIPFAVSRGIILAVALCLEWLLKSGAVGYSSLVERGLLPTLSRIWDAGWYIDIAVNGYSTSANYAQELNWHFFPLYPFSMRMAGDFTGLGRLDGGYALAGTILSHVFFFAALVMLHRLTLLVWGDATLAKHSVWLVAALPWAFIFSTAYAESLYLMITVAAMLTAYIAHTSPTIVTVAAPGLLAALTMLTRPQGFLTALVVVWLVAVAPRQISLGRRLLYAAFGGIPTALAMLGFDIYIARISGTDDLMALSKSTRAWGGGLLADMQHVLVLPPENPVWLQYFLATLALLLWVGLTCYLVGRYVHMSRDKASALNVPESDSPAKWAFAIYAVAALLVTVASNPMHLGWGRYMLMVFPCIWALAWWAKGKVRFGHLVVMCLALQITLYGATLLADVTP
jgi:hypothetical protein